LTQVVQTKSFDHYWLVLVRLRVVVFLTMAAAAATAYVTSLVIDPVYDARTQFYVVDDVDTGGVLLSGAAGRQSRGAILPAMAEPTIATHIGILQTDAIRKIVHERVPQKPMPQLERDVDVWPVKKYLLGMRAWDEDPKVAAAVANAYPAALNEFLQSVAAQRARDNLRVLQESRAELETQLRTARKQREGFFDLRHTPSLKDELNKLLDRKSNLESSIQTTEARVQGIDQRIARAEEQLEREARVSMSSLGALSSSVIQRLMKEVSDTEAELAGARTEFDGKQGDKHPRIKSLMATLAQKQHNLRMENAGLQTSEVKTPLSFYEQLRREILNHYKDRTATKAELAENRVALARLTARIERQQRGLSTEAEITAEVARLERMLDSAVLAIRNSQIDAAVQSDLVMVLSEASVATKPTVPVPLFNTFVAAVLGLIAGVYLAFAYDWLARVRVRARAARDTL